MHTSVLEITTRIQIALLFIIHKTFAWIALSRTWIFPGNGWCLYSWAWKEIHCERWASFKPGLHSDLFDSAPCIREPCRELCQVHAAIVGEILLFSLSWVRIRLVFFDPFHENGCVSHPSDRVRECASCFFVMRWTFIKSTFTHNTIPPVRLKHNRQLRFLCTLFQYKDSYFNLIRLINGIIRLLNFSPSHIYMNTVRNIRIAACKVFHWDEVAFVLAWYSKALNIPIYGRWSFCSTHVPEQLYKSLYVQWTYIIISLLIHLTGNTKLMSGLFWHAMQTEQVIA